MSKSTMAKMKSPNTIVALNGSQCIKIINMHLFWEINYKADSNFGSISTATLGKKTRYIQSFYAHSNVTTYLKLLELSTVQIIYRLPLSKYLTVIHLWNVFAANLSTTISGTITVEWNSLTILS